MSDDDRNLDDLRAVSQALEIAREALRKAMEGRGPAAREEFMFQVGYARGKLSLVCDRIYPAKKEKQP